MKSEPTDFLAQIVTDYTSTLSDPWLKGPPRTELADATPGEQADSARGQ
jgi:hypothetical protein